MTAQWVDVTLSDIHLTRTENNVVRLEKPLLYKRFVDDIINRRKKNDHDIAFENLNKYYPSQQKFFTKCPKDLHRSKRISSNFEMQIKVIKRKFRNADYPPKFLNSVIHQFFTPKKNDSFVIPPDLFEESKLFILVELPDCEEKENTSKHFIKNFEAFTNQGYRIAIKWIRRKVK